MADSSTQPAVPASTLLSLLYSELRKLAAARMAGERVGHTLTATALVHEAYLRVSGERHLWSSRAQFFTAAAEAMRRVLIDHAKGRKAAKRGGGALARTLEGLDLAAPADPEQTLALDRELEELKAQDPDAYEVVMLRFFAGVTPADAAAMTGVTERTAKRRWQRARLWLLARLHDPGGEGTKARGAGHGA